MALYSIIWQNSNKMYNAALTSTVNELELPLSPDEIFMPIITTQINQAVLELKAGKPVAIPTETVYGLAAMVNKPEAIKAVFAMKNRPLNHPLIVHIAKEWDLSTLVANIPSYAQQLIKSFWPGPLTLVFHAKKDAVNPLITGGQETVAIRCPAHPIAQKLLQRIDTPLVAPSANPFGKISPTTALHVKHSFPDKQLLILNGGRCHIGIESTIVNASDAHHYQILRHGLINEQAIAKVANVACLEKTEHIRAPGLLASHYQPNKTLYYFENQLNIHRFCQNREGDVYVIAKTKPETVPSTLFHPLSDIPDKAAFDLYHQLREADSSQALCIAIELPPNESAWYGIRERIMKAGFAYDNQSR